MDGKLITQHCTSSKSETYHGDQWVTVEVEVRPDGEAELKTQFVSLAGTFVNCAGGETPWGSWLTCEETTASTGMPHGYVFEVPADGFGDPTPIRDMGRFSHEAVAIDPFTGYVYETEDAGASLMGFFGASSKSGFYRFVPNVSGRLAAGGRPVSRRTASWNAETDSQP